MSIPEYFATAVAGRYVVDREIGRGGMATVYLARDVRHDRAVALKLLEPEIGAILGVDRFLAEIRVTATLQHPHLLPLFDSGEVNGQPFYVMPYVEGETLRQRLQREKQLPVDEAVRIAAAVASALEYAHARGVIHRDLKPENILIHAGEPVVADFGIALAVSKAGGTRITQTGLSLGTPQYMSPEQATGDRTIDGRSDIYSLAALTYEMLTGDPPHTGSTMQAVISRVLTERPRAVRVQRPTVPEHAAFAIERALEKLPADRWATAREFADALQGKTVAPSRTDVSSPDASTALRGIDATRVLRRTRDPVVLAALGVGAVGVAAALWGWRRAPQPQPGLTVRYAITLGEAAREMPPNTHVAISPDGRYVAYVIRDVTGRQVLALRDLSQLTDRVIPGTTSTMTPFFSPDGAWVGLVMLGNQGVKKVPVNGGPVVHVADAGGVQGVTWAPGDVIIASVRDTLMSVPASGGTFWPIAGGGADSAERGRRSPRLLSDGRSILYQSWRGSFADSRIGIMTLATGKATILDGVGGSPIGLVDGYLIYGTSTGVIMAAPLDTDKRRITGASVPVVEQAAFLNSGLVRAAVSRSGSLAYVTGARTSQVLLVDTSGASRVLLDAPRSYSSPRFSPDGTKLALTVTEGGKFGHLDPRHRVADIHEAHERRNAERTRGVDAGWQAALVRVEPWRRRSPRDLATERGLERCCRFGGKRPGRRQRRRAQPGWADARVLDGAQRSQPDIFYRRLIGDTARKPLATTSYGELAPKFSRDGKWVAYASNQDGGLQVYVQPFPPTGSRYQITSTVGMAPVWSRDGSRVFYVADGRMNVATIRTSPTFAVTSRRPLLFEGPYMLNVPPYANYDLPRRQAVRSAAPRWSK